MKFHEKSRDLEKFFSPKKIFQNPKNLFYLFFEKKKIFKIFFIFFSLFFLFFPFFSRIFQRSQRSREILKKKDKNPENLDFFFFLPKKDKKRQKIFPDPCLFIYLFIQGFAPVGRSPGAK